MREIIEAKDLVELGAELDDRSRRHADCPMCGTLSPQTHSTFSPMRKIDGYVMEWPYAGYGEPVYTCPRCQRRFVEQESPRQKQRTYFGLGVFAVLIVCGFLFSTASDGEEAVTVRTVVERAAFLLVISAIGLAYFMGLRHGRRRK